MNKIKIDSEQANQISLINKFGNQYKGINNRIIVLPFIGKGKDDKIYFKNQESGYWEIVEQELYIKLEGNLSEFIRLSEESVSQKTDSVVVSTKNFKELNIVADKIENLKKKMYTK